MAFVRAGALESPGTDMSYQIREAPRTMSLLRRMEKLQQEAAAREAEAPATDAVAAPAAPEATPREAGGAPGAAAGSPGIAEPGATEPPGAAEPPGTPETDASEQPGQPTAPVAAAAPAPLPVPSTAAAITAAAAAATAAATGVPAPSPGAPIGAVAAPASTAQTAPQASRMTSRSATREDLLRDIRIRLRAEAARQSASLAALDGAELRGRIEGIVDRLVGPGGYAVTRDERLRLIQDMLAGIEGLGPIESFLKDETITEVMVNGPNQVYIERAGKIHLTDAVFLNDDHVLQIIDRIVSPIGRRIDQSSPRVDARLPDGSRVNVIIEPLSLVGPVITIRKFSANPYTVEDLISFGTATAEMFDFLRVCVEARLNIFVSGGTGSGKTTTLNVLSSFIPEDERIVTIEDAAELQLRQGHVITLESRPPNLEGLGEITIRDLLRNSLHMRPDRIIVGECRGGEALDMIQAMTVGHEGSLSTGHANSPADMLRRLETMVLMAGVDCRSARSASRSPPRSTSSSTRPASRTAPGRS